MNALCQKETWGALRRTRISTQPRPRTMEVLLHSLEVLPTRIEPADAPEVWRRVGMELPRTAGPERISGLQALVEWASVEFILEPGKIRIVPHDEAVKYWSAWWEAEKK